MSQFDDISDAQRASEVLNDPVFVAARIAAEQKYTQEWKRGKTPEERERAHCRAIALDEVVSQLKVIVGRGVVAQDSIEDQARRDSQ